ncbi:uncharacterized protein LOC115225961 isoform X2 [Octopus sinensis]|uniref:Uncharacterized protein LOC115225961 isoform X2 n=1 Tax=Octopus sinensis TaxID=2607531 RepID=A0A7E6FTA5_9MOLL|nr:uncharacterized protein LOC115225961 isoform X2 [Octopus sinensis]
MFHHVVSYRRSLVFILCTILFLETQADSDICNTCYCNSFTTIINCINRNLLSIPQPIPTNVEYLYLGYNNIATIKEGAFTGLSNLKELYLDNNKISRIEKEMFRGLHNLEKLNLGANNIFTSKEGAFTGLSNLKYLYLGSNNIATIKEGAFTGLSNLKELYLRYNNIATIKEGAFTGLSNLNYLYLRYNNIATIKEGAFTGLSNLNYLSLYRNKILRIEKEMFQGLHNLEKLDLGGNSIATIKEGTFTGISNFKELSLYNNKISRIEKEMFQGLHNLEKLYLHNNPIEKYEDGAFLFLPSIATINLGNNNLKRCGCHLPAFVKYIKEVYNRTVAVFGTCQEGSGKRIPILDYSQCQNYSLFQRNLQCQTSSGIICNEVTSCPGTEPVCRFAISMNGAKLKTERSCSTYRKCVEAMRNNTLTCNKRTNGTSCTGCCVGHLCNKNDFIDYSLFQRNLQCQTCSGIICNEVTSCPGTEPVCRFAISMNGAKLKTERSCSTYRKCVEAMRNNTLTCNKRTNGTSCTGCCVGHLCNKNDFIGWTKSLVFRFIFKKFNEYKIPAENISRAIEHDLSTVTGTFRVEDCGSNRNKIFAIYCTVFSEMTESQLWHNISETLNKSQAFLNLGVKKSQMKFLDEMVCDESTTSTNNRAFSWPMTKIGTTAEIPCNGNVATRHCSSRTMGHPEMASSQNLSSQKCSPFTGIWQEPDMSQCYNAEQSKGIDDGWTKSFAFRLILKSFNEYKKPAENISKVMEHEFLTVTGKFRVEYPRFKYW